MKKEVKKNSEIKADKEKMIIENFASVMKNLDPSFLTESEAKDKNNQEEK